MCQDYCTIPLCARVLSVIFHCKISKSTQCYSVKVNEQDEKDLFSPVFWECMVFTFATMHCDVNYLKERGKIKALYHFNSYKILLCKLLVVALLFIYSLITLKYSN